MRLRESHFRWRSREEATGSVVKMLRSQLVLGLLPGPVQTELQRRVRWEPDLIFEEACKEVKAMEKEAEQATVDGVDTRRTYNNPPSPLILPHQPLYKTGTASMRHSELSQLMSCGPR